MASHPKAEVSQVAARAAKPEEARGRELLAVSVAWPLGREIRARQRFSTDRLPMVDRSLRIDRFCVFRPHDFQPDRLSESVTGRSTFEQTYARPSRPKTDNELPSDILESVQYNQMPQFILRNIGRFEMAIDLDDRLPLVRVPGIGGDFGSELDEVRKARVPVPKMAEIWSVAYVGRLRASLRRLLIEDPWEMKYGSEAGSGHEGKPRDFVVEGTHPDDAPGADWGPTLVPLPAEWQGPPPGQDAMERPYDIAADMAKTMA